MFNDIGGVLLFTIRWQNKIIFKGIYLIIYQIASQISNAFYIVNISLMTNNGRLYGSIIYAYKITDTYCVEDVYIKHAS